MILILGASLEVLPMTQGASREPSVMLEVLMAERLPLREPCADPTKDVSSMSTPSSKAPERPNEVCTSTITSMP